MKNNFTVKPSLKKQKVHKLYLLLASIAIFSGVIYGLFEDGKFNLSSLQYFTYLSNILSAIGLLLLLVFYNKMNFPRHALISIILLAISVTGIVYNFILVPINNNDIFYKSYQNFSNHFFSVLLVLANYFIFEKKGGLKYRHLLFGIAFPFLYWMFFITFGGFFDSYPYFFMDLNSLTLIEAIGWLFILLALFLFLGLLLLFFDNFRGKNINRFYQILCRIYQFIFKMIAYLLPWREPIIIQGENSIGKIPEILLEKNITNILIVTDNTLYGIGIPQRLENPLIEKKINYHIFKEVPQNPTITTAEKAVSIYKKYNCQAIIAIGGGSVIDCAKAAGAGTVKNKNFLKMKGVLKVLKKLPTLIAVPTTAGTGSEATLAAVLIDETTHLKFAINDISLIPHYAILDPLLIVDLPKSITASTGMDALTHAIEAYIGNSNTKKTKRYAEKSLRLIKNNFEATYENASDIVARNNMLMAAHLAGKAFTRAYVGNIHAAAHTLSGFYGIPHGVANATLLPIILKYYDKSVHKKLAKIATIMSIGELVSTDEQKANQLIEYINNLNTKMEIPKHFSQIKKTDMPKMIKHALKEANPLYPVPQIFNKNDFENIFRAVSLEEL